MTFPSRPVQPATHRGTACWLLTAAQLTDEHLGHRMVAGAPEGILTAYARCDEHSFTLTLADGRIVTVMDTKQLLVTRDRP